MAESNLFKNLCNTTKYYGCLPNLIKKTEAKGFNFLDAKKTFQYLNFTDDSAYIKNYFNSRLIKSDILPILQQERSTDTLKLLSCPCTISSVKKFFFFV